jgi:DNA-binding response OmpR family regulator
MEAQVVYCGKREGQWPKARRATVFRVESLPVLSNTTATMNPSKILLARLSPETIASTERLLVDAGYNVSVSPLTEMAAVLGSQPDLMILQTDVATLDCCGLLAQLKLDPRTQTMKVILLAFGGALERSRALDLGADDVLSLPFESSELLARIRAELREKMPDDRLRSELQDAQRKEHEAEAALSAVVGERKVGRKRWLGLLLLAILAALGALLAYRNARQNIHQNAQLTLELNKLNSEVLSQRDLLQRAQKAREAAMASAGSTNLEVERLRGESNALRERISASSGPTASKLQTQLRDTTARLGRLENETSAAEHVVRDYSGSICLIHIVLGFFERSSGQQLRFAGVDQNGDPVADSSGNPQVTTSGDGRPVHLNVFGTGFLIDSRGHILTNHHVLEPWWGDPSELPVPLDKFEPTVLSARAYFPGFEAGLPMHVEQFSKDADLGLASVTLPKNPPRPLLLDNKNEATTGMPVVLIGYPTGIEGIAVRLDDATLKQIAESSGGRTEDIVAELGKRRLIRPLATQGHLGSVSESRLVYDAQTTHGGSGGPVFASDGKVVGVNFAILSSFSGSNLAVPIAQARKLVDSITVKHAAR